MPAGRPEKPLDLGKIRRLAARGLCEREIAAALGVQQETLIRRKKKYREFREALSAGQSRGIAKIASALFEKAIGGDTTAMIFYLKARAGWKDKIELAGDPEAPIRYVISARSLTPEEWAREYGDDSE